MADKHTTLRMRTYRTTPFTLLCLPTSSSMTRQWLCDETIINKFVWQTCGLISECSMELDIVHNVSWQQTHERRTHAARALTLMITRPVWWQYKWIGRSLECLNARRWDCWQYNSCYIVCITRHKHKPHHHANSTHSSASRNTNQHKAKATRANYTCNNVVRCIAFGRY